MNTLKSLSEYSVARTYLVIFKRIPVLVKPEGGNDFFLTEAQLPGMSQTARFYKLV